MPVPEHEHTKENSWWEYDAQNIPLCRVCELCREERLSRYRPEILSGYAEYIAEELAILEIGARARRVIQNTLQ